MLRDLSTGILRGIGSQIYLCEKDRRQSPNFLGKHTTKRLEMIQMFVFASQPLLRWSLLFCRQKAGHILQLHLRADINLKTHLKRRENNTNLNDRGRLSLNVYTF